MAASVREGSGQFNAATSEPPSRARIRVALDGIRPGLIAEGGNLELVDVADDGTVTIELQGACRRCPAAPATMHYVIERRLRRIPGVTAVLAV
jgi:Fe-S cluster biogenesis protein NfuA